MVGDANGKDGAAAAATVAEVLARCKAVCNPKGYECLYSSWEDVQRFCSGKSLSSLGANIKDVRLFQRNGTLLFTVRKPNWNETLGYVSAQKLRLTVNGGKTVFLSEVLAKPPAYFSYAGLCSRSLAAPGTDEIVTVRFQAVFVPLPSTSGAATEFCVEVYDYNTVDDNNPRNVLLLCTPQGTAVYQDTVKTQKLFLHAVDNGGVIHRHWIKAASSGVLAGQDQAQAAEEGAAPVANGINGMGRRFNVAMFVQIPIGQTPVVDSLSPAMGLLPSGRDGKTTAAVLSLGSEEPGPYPGVRCAAPQREPGQHVTVTITMYYAVAGGVPSECDVAAVVDDLTGMYQSCAATKELAACDGVTGPFCSKAMQQIVGKVTSHPYQPA